MDEICPNPADTSLSDFFRQEEEEDKKLDEGKGESEEAPVKGDVSRMDGKDDNDTLENGEQALEHSGLTNVSHQNKKALSPFYHKKYF